MFDKQCAIVEQLETRSPNKHFVRSRSCKSNDPFLLSRFGGSHPRGTLYSGLAELMAFGNQVKEQHPKLIQAGSTHGKNSALRWLTEKAPDVMHPSLCFPVSSPCQATCRTPSCPISTTRVPLKSLHPICYDNCLQHIYNSRTAICRS